jgi:hypothetical protein
MLKACCNHAKTMQMYDAKTMPKACGGHTKSMLKATVDMLKPCQNHAKTMPMNHAKNMLYHVKTIQMYKATTMVKTCHGHAKSMM